MNFQNYTLLEEIADLDAIPAGNIPVVLYTGRFQPFHKGHLEFIKRIIKKYPKYKVLVGIIKGIKSSSDKNINPLGFGLQKKLILKGLGEYVKNVIVFPREFSTGYIPTIFKVLREDDYEVKVIIAGEDRADDYKEIVNLLNTQFDTIDIKVEVAKERYFSVSGTEVRTAIKSDNFEKFKKFVPMGMWEYYWEIQKEINDV